MNKLYRMTEYGLEHMIPKVKREVFSKKQNRIIINITEFYSVIKNNKCKERYI